MQWTAVDESREFVGTLALPLAVAETLYGGSNPVHKYWDPAFQRYVVGKRIPLFDRPLLGELHEPRLQHRLKHDHLVPVIDVGDILDLTVDPPTRIANEVELLTPFYEDGSVFDALGRGAAFDVCAILDITRATALGLAELHSEGFVHRDLKSPNVFLTRDGNRARVGDLGEAHPIDAAGQAPGIDSPTPWIAPEQVAQNAATVVSDLFGLGVMLSELLQGGLDLTGYRRRAAHERMCRGRTPLPRRLLEPPPWSPPAIRTLVRGLTRSHPDNRTPRSAMEVADRLATAPAISWSAVSDHRWEGVPRGQTREYAVDARHLPRKKVWEVSVLRHGGRQWRAIVRTRHAVLDYKALQSAFDLALADCQ